MITDTTRWRRRMGAGASACWLLLAGCVDPASTAEQSPQVVRGDARALGVTDPVQAPDHPHATETAPAKAVAARDGELPARLAAVAGMTATGDDTGTALLVGSALGDAEPTLRAEAVAGLGEIGSDSSVPVLEQVLSDPDPMVRRAAVEALVAIGGAYASYTLQRALDDPDPSIRGLALDAVEDPGPSIAVMTGSESSRAD
jgi:HEAT repeat protein